MHEEIAPEEDRHETVFARLDRNYGELLQELRVAETGVQILFGFMLAVAFQQRFAGIDTFQRTVYVITLMLSTVSVGLLVAPVAFHRIVFRHGLKDELVAISNVLALAGISSLLLAVLSGVLLVLDVVIGTAFAVSATAVLAVFFISLWVVLPLHRLREYEAAQRTLRQS